MPEDKLRVSTKNTTLTWEIKNATLSRIVLIEFIATPTSVGLQQPHAHRLPFDLRRAQMLEREFRHVAMNRNVG